ncbi:alpha/beta hydrolase [Isoptericola sp. b441]|uniref:Alpha/beta hydrolase n=1 Tax=Actinotalea lenta TaxID=3064654 RepID=A0ABT9DB35_9CELL|nr:MULTISPECIES: alpha/beta hydrolase [unclassified Isoptericola]MDO8108109.1 alpha/beta hydrolase [Isoptericola sp. b441]MDO8120221.1 alpha/beta hydrolase [Isoptericola sp. b490]
MRYRIALTSALAVVLLGALGALAGPGWDPVPMTATIDVETPDTTIGQSQGTEPIGTYDVVTSVVTVRLNGASVEAQISEPVGARGLRPGVVFVHGAGTGKFTRAFRTQAHALASAGVVTMVPNKRLDTYTTRHRDYVAMANDYLRSVELLRGLPGVDPDRVGVFGESEGCWIVPVMAADNPRVAFTILTAAPVVPPRQQAAFAVDSYLRNTGVPVEVLRAIPRTVGMELPGGGFGYIDFDVEPFQQRMRQPVLIVYGTGDAAMPTVQGALQIIDDVSTAGNPDWTVRYYKGADHGIKVDGKVDRDFLRDMAAWIQGLPATGHADPRVAGAEPHQRFLASPVARPRWYAEGDMLVALLVTIGISLLVAPVTWLVRRLRGHRTPALSEGVPVPLAVMSVSAASSFALFVVYLLVVANLAQNYRTNALVVQGGWLLVRLLGLISVVAGVVLAYRVLDGRRRRHVRASRTVGGRWCLIGSLTGSAMLLTLLAYWNVFPALL